MTMTDTGPGATSDQRGSGPLHTIIKDQYRIDAKLGEGGPSIVYRGMDLLMEIPVAIKKLKRTDSGLNDTARFLREARTQARLVHENIVSIRTILEDEGEHYIIMELIEGEPLDEMIYASKLLPRLPVLDVVSYATQTLRGLGHAHSKGVLHRDIKPPNIMITNEGIAKLADFGIARAIRDQRITQTGLIIGTPAYMSPEQIRAMDLDNRTDIYSLGITIYKALCGHSTFENPAFQKPDLFEMLRRHTMEEPIPLARLGVELPPALDDAILKSLAKEPDDRYPHCDAFREAIEQSIDRTPIEVAGGTMSLSASDLVPQATGDMVAPPAPPKPPPVGQDTQPSTPPEVGSENPVIRVWKAALWPALAWLAAMVARLARAAVTGWKKSDPTRKKLIVVGVIGAVSVLINVIVLLRPGASVEPAVRERAPSAGRAMGQVRAHSRSPVQPAAQRRQTPMQPTPRLPQPRARQAGPTPAPLVAPAGRPTARPVARPAAPKQPKAVAPPAARADGPKGAIRWKSHLVKIPAGYFYQGTNDKDTRSTRDATPMRRVYLDTFWIDRAEVTTAQYRKCVEAGVCKRIMQRYHVFRWRDLTKTLPPTAPIAYVYWREAAQFCSWAGKRLPTEAEWEKAARGTTKNIYPWGSQRPTCQRARRSGCGPRGADGSSKPQDRSAGKSPYGLFDMSGSVAEWVQDCYMRDAYEKLPLRNPLAPNRRCYRHVVRGGCWYTRDRVKLRTYHRATGPRRRIAGHGFRCAWSPTAPQPSKLP